MLASYFGREERFTLCFKVVGELSNVEIYVFVFFAYVDTRAWPLFRLQRCTKFCVFFFWLPHRSSASAILMGPNATVMRQYAFPIGTNKLLS